MDAEIKGGLFASLTAGVLWIGRFPGRLTRVEENYDRLDKRSERIENKLDSLTEILLEKKL